MAQQTINVGAAPNDGTGTPLRTAFQYTNSNFTELYTAVGPSGNNIVVPGTATISGDLTVDTNVFKVDTTLNRVGIGTATPTSDLDIFRTSGSGITSGISLRTAAGAGGDGSFIKWLAGGTNEKVAQIDGVLNGTDVGYLSFQCGNGADAMAEQYRIASSGVFTWYDGAGGTRMTLNSTGLGIGGAPAGRLSLQTTSGQTNLTLKSAGSTLGAIIGLQADGTAYFYQGDALPITFSTTGTERMRIDASGNVGIGVTPSAITGGRGLEVGAVGNGLWCNNSTYNQLLQNAYQSGASFTGWKYAAVASTQSVRVELGGGSFSIYNAPAGTAGNDITWTNRFTLDASGNLLVGPTGVHLAAHSAFQNNASGQVTFRNTSTTAGRYFNIGMNSGSSMLVVDNNGTGVYLDYATTSWASTSDERLKDIIEPISNAVAKVGSLRSVIGKFKTDSEGTRRSFLIAQDVQSVLPEAVDMTNADAFGVRYSEVIPLLVAAIKELTARVQTLETR